MAGPVSARYVIVDCPQCATVEPFTPGASAGITIPDPFVCGLCFNLRKVRVSKANIPVVRWIDDQSRVGGGFWACDETAIGRLGALTDEEPE